MERREPRRKLTIRITTCDGITVSTWSYHIRDIDSFERTTLRNHGKTCGHKNRFTGRCHRVQIDRNVFSGTITPNEQDGL